MHTASAVSGGLPTRYLTQAPSLGMVAPVMCRPSSEAKKSNGIADVNGTPADGTLDGSLKVCVS